MLDQRQPPTNLGCCPSSNHSLYPELPSDSRGFLPAETLFSRDSSMLACLFSPLSPSTVEFGDSISTNLSENNLTMPCRVERLAIEARRHSQSSALGITDCIPDASLLSPFDFYSNPLSGSEAVVRFGSPRDDNNSDHFSDLSFITTPTHKAEYPFIGSKLSGANISSPTTASDAPVNNRVRIIGKGQRFHVSPHALGTFQPSEDNHTLQIFEPSQLRVPPGIVSQPDESKSRTSFFRTAGPSDPNACSPPQRTHQVDRQRSEQFQTCVEVSRAPEKTKTVGKKEPMANSRRFPCPMCGHKFARAFNLQTHIGTHAGMRPFSCPAEGCSKAFSRRHDLGRHVGAVHRDWLSHKKLSVTQAVKPMHYKDDMTNICHDIHGMIRQKT